jgi:hypothetical protein
MKSAAVVESFDLAARRSWSACAPNVGATVHLDVPHDVALAAHDRSTQPFLLVPVVADVHGGADVERLGLGVLVEVDLDLHARFLHCVHARRKEQIELQAWLAFQE